MCSWIYYNIAVFAQLLKAFVPEVFLDRAERARVQVLARIETYHMNTIVLFDNAVVDGGSFDHNTVHHCLS